MEVYWADSTDRRNISKLEVLYGTTTGLGNGADRARADALAGPTRRQSAGDQTDVLEVHCRGDAKCEAAALACGVSQPLLGPRWFREADGMAPISLLSRSGRYLSFAEREELALLKAERHGIREIARRLGRSPSTISARAEA